ncbi:MAG: hypothetical protein J6A10_09080 [Peptococcaceae bacterium]|nr:hypothetical protein [Peptococcaceae bacterium]MBO5430095.1 hypothetical protein [Peptococcaceae bacterium]
MASIRDLTCINSVSHMAEYGKYEEEFLVYGCSCLEGSKIVYRISPRYEEIAHYVCQAAQKNLYPSPIQSIMRRHTVLTGQHQQLLYETELELAKVLQKSYSRQFFDGLSQCISVRADDGARNFFDTLRVQLNGIFSESVLQIFEGLVDMAYRAKHLTDDTWKEIQSWLRKVKTQMEYDVVAKKPFVRTFYGFCYIDGKGKYQYKANAQKDIVVEELRKLKRQGLAVSPIFQKTYWYDYGVEPKVLREAFKQELIVYYDEVYWQHWQAIKALPSVVDLEMYADQMARIEAEGTKEEKEAFLEYGYDWNVR